MMKNKCIPFFPFQKLSAGAKIVLAFVILILIGFTVSPINKLYSRPMEIKSFMTAGVFESYGRKYKGSHQVLILDVANEKKVIQFWGIYSRDKNNKQLKPYLGQDVVVNCIEGPKELFQELYHPYSIVNESGEIVFEVDKEKLIGKVWEVTSFDYFVIFLTIVTFVYFVIVNITQYQHKEIDDGGK